MAEYEARLDGIEADSSQKNEQDKKNPAILESKKNAEIALVPAERMTRVKNEETLKQKDVLKMVQRIYNEGEIDLVKDILKQSIVKDTDEMEMQSQTETLAKKQEISVQIIKEDFSNTLIEVLLKRLDEGKDINFENTETRKEIAQEVLNILEEKYVKADAAEAEKLLGDEEKGKKAKQWLQEKGYLSSDENGENAQDFSSLELVRAFQHMLEKAEKETNSEQKLVLYNQFISGIAEQLGKSETEVLAVIQAFRSPLFKKFKQELERKGVENSLNTDGSVNKEFLESSWQEFEEKYKQEEPELAKKLFSEKPEKQERKEEAGGVFFETNLQGKDFIEFFKHDPILQNLQGQPALQNLWQKGTQLTIRRTPDGPAYLLKFPTESGTQEIDFVLGDESAVFMRLSGQVKKLDGVSLKEFLAGDNPETTRKMNQFYSRAFLETTAFSGLFEHSTSAESLPEKNDAFQFLSEAFVVSSGEVFHETANFRNNFDKVLKIALGIDGNIPFGETDRLQMFTLEKDGKLYSLLDNQGKLKTSANRFFQNIQTLLAQNPAIENQRELFSHPSFDVIAQQL